MQKYILFSLLALFLFGCPNEDDLDQNFFNDRYTFGEHYYSLNPDANANIGDYIIFQLERNNQQHQYSYDFIRKIANINNDLTSDTIPNLDTHFDRNGDGIIGQEDRGIDRIPVYIYKSSLPDISINYRFETSNNFIFRLRNFETNDIVFELDASNTQYQLEIGSNSDFSAGRYVYEMESNYLAEDIGVTLRNRFEQGDTVMYVFPVIIQPDRVALNDDTRQTIDTDLRDEFGNSVDRDLLLEDTFILISDSRCIDCKFNTFPNENSLVERFVNGELSSVELPNSTQKLVLNEINFQGADFSFADFSNSAFIRSSFGTPTFGSNNPRPTNFNNATMVDCNFAQAEFISDTTSESNRTIDIDMSNASFFSSEMVEVRMIGVYGLFTNFEACSFGPNAVFRNNSLSNCDLIGMEAQFSDFSNNDFSFSDLSKTRFNYSNMRNTNMRRADLVNCDFRGANCVGADFCFSYQIALRLDSIITDETTLCDPSLNTSQTF